MKRSRAVHNLDRLITEEDEYVYDATNMISSQGSSLKVITENLTTIRSRKRVTPNSEWKKPFFPDDDIIVEKAAEEAKTVVTSVMITDDTSSFRQHVTNSQFEKPKLYHNDELFCNTSEAWPDPRPPKSPTCACMVDSVSALLSATTLGVNVAIHAERTRKPHLNYNYSDRLISCESNRCQSSSNLIAIASLSKTIAALKTQPNGLASSERISRLCL